jgi:ubiquinone/menaquinone biosynthesis C-methylase UbiE
MSAARAGRLRSERSRLTDMKSSGATLRGIERLAVFNRLRASFGLRWELPPLLSTVAIPAGSTCLEIGTGLGWGTVGLLRHGTSPAVVTTDYESAILQRAQAFVREKQPGSRVDYARVDAKALPFRTERFDFVLSLYVLHHAEGYRAALAEMARVLKPGGHALVLDLMRPAFVPQLPASVAPEGVLTKTEWRELFQTCGFVIVRWQVRYFLGPLPRCSIVARRSRGPG